MPARPVVIVMGVAGAGKTTVGRLIAADAGLPFLDADDYHSVASIARMHAGLPLRDRDRLPWLDRLNAELHTRERDRGAVLACSALTEAYRGRLLAGLPRAAVVLLTGSPELLHERLAARHGHFAGPELLASQLATLERPRGAVVVDVAPAPEQVAHAALDGLARRGILPLSARAGRRRP